MITTRRNIINYYIKPYINIAFFSSILIFYIFIIATKGVEFNSFKDIQVLFYFLVLVLLLNTKSVSNNKICPYNINY
jgi:hypothetical protein